jgi:hypothetical protein
LPTVAAVQTGTTTQTILQGNRAVSFLAMLASLCLRVPCLRCVSEIPAASGALAVFSATLHDSVACSRKFPPLMVGQLMGTATSQRHAFFF